MKHILGGYGLVLRDMDTPLVATVLPSVTTVTVVSAQRIQLRVSSSLWVVILSRKFALGGYGLLPSVATVVCPRWLRVESPLVASDFCPR